MIHCMKSNLQEKEERKLVLSKIDRRIKTSCVYGVEVAQVEKQQYME